MANPPGSTGLPLVGETLSFLKDPYGFVEERRKRHGPIFRTSLLGRKTAIIAGPEASKIWLDPGKVMREGSMPGSIQVLFGGRELPVLPMLDGDAHRVRKALMLAGFTPEALAAYLPVLQGIFERHLADWARRGEVTALDELKRLSIEAICTTVMGIEGPALGELLEEYGRIIAGFVSLPIPLPWTAYTRALKSLDRVIARFEQVAREHLECPRDDALSRMLAAEVDGKRMTPSEAAREMHHIVAAGYIIYGPLSHMIRLFADDAALADRCRAEVMREAPSGTMDHGMIARMTYLGYVVQETKRHCPIVPTIFGLARDQFELNGYTVPAGWAVMLSPWAANRFEEVWTEPERFDPEHFARGEDQRFEDGFAPQGPGPVTGHKCLGLDLSNVILSVFAAVLLRGYRVELLPQDLSRRWNLVPPEPTSGLKVRLHPVDAQAGG